MTLLQKVKAYNKAVPFICNRQDYEGAWYQFTSEYYNTMLKALQLSDEDIKTLANFAEDDIILPPILIDYPIDIVYNSCEHI